jgi:hypothetical protein
MTRSGASRALFILFACTVGAALAAPPPPPPLPPPRPPPPRPPQPPSPPPPPPQPSLLSVLTSLLLSSAGSDLDQVLCAQAVAQQLAPAVTPINATQPSGTLQLTISNIICAGCYSGEHTCPTGVEPDGNKVTFVKLTNTWRWRCRASSQHNFGLNLGPGAPATKLQTCRLQSSPVLIIAIVLPAVASGILCGFGAFWILRRRRRAAQQQRQFVQHMGLAGSPGADSMMFRSQQLVSIAATPPAPAAGTGAGPAFPAGTVAVTIGRPVIPQPEKPAATVTVHHI